jgi:hypothetical protein
MEEFTKDTETVFIEVDDNRDRLVVALEERGVLVTSDGHGLYIEGSDESVYDKIRAALVESEAPLRRMAPRKGDLTELFRLDGEADPRDGEADPGDGKPGPRDGDAGPENGKTT